MPLASLTYDHHEIRNAYTYMYIYIYIYTYIQIYLYRSLLAPIARIGYIRRIGPRRPLSAVSAPIIPCHKTKLKLLLLALTKRAQVVNVVERCIYCNIKSGVPSLVCAEFHMNTSVNVDSLSRVDT